MSEHTLYFILRDCHSLQSIPPTLSVPLEVSKSRWRPESPVRALIRPQTGDLGDEIANAIQRNY
jgi:hypothetical protein